MGLSALSGGTFHDANLSALEGTGLSVALATEGGVLRVMDDEERPLVAVSAADTPAVYDPEERNVLFIDPADSGPVAVKRSDGSGALFFIDDGARTVCAIETSDVELATVPAPDVKRWATDLGDEWVAALAGSVASRGGPFAHAAAAGYVLRLADGTAIDQKKRFAAMLAGEGDISSEAPRNWVASLSSAERSAIVIGALRTTEEVRFRLQEQKASMALDADYWWEELLRLSKRREAVQGVRDLLATIGESQAIDARLVSLDADATSFMRALPIKRVTNDEMLRRASRGHGPTWWTSIGMGRSA